MGTFVRMTDVFGPKVRGMACSPEILWDPGGVGASQLAVCDDCFWLMTLIALFRCMLTYNPPTFTVALYVSERCL